MPRRSPRHAPTGVVGALNSSRRSDKFAGSALYGQSRVPDTGLLAEQLGEWLTAAFSLPANLKVKVVAFVRAKARGTGSAEAAERATSVHGAIERLTDA